MKFGYIKIATITPKIQVADTKFNAKQIISFIERADNCGVELAVFPELCITGYTCGDLFYSDTLLSGALAALKDISACTKGKKMLAFVGLPIKKDGQLYNVAAAISNGVVLGFTPKTYMPNYNEFYEKRYFASFKGQTDTVIIKAENFAEDSGDIFVPFGTKLLYCDLKDENFKVAAEICEDLWTVSPPSCEHAVNGAIAIVNLSCSDETIGKAEYRRQLVKMQSAKLNAAYIYADAGDGESTTDMVFGGHDIISENGEILAESQLFTTGMTVAEVDLAFLAYERSKTFNYDFKDRCADYTKISFSAWREDMPTRKYNKNPFVPSDSSIVAERAELIVKIQAEGLKKRLAHTRAKSAVLGLSGGLDSTLAILVTVKAAELIGLDRKSVIAVTMPCFGTTSRTYENTVKLAKALGVTLKKVDITKSVLRHLKDIKHGGEKDVTYENAQARERTQVIMDIANQTGGIVVGTGDLSELALGWATYNGDHMSMYGVNASVPKTLVRHIVGFYAERSKGKLKAVLIDILDTPVSPELLPPENGDIAQKTEDIVGPYILHDFFLYCFLRKGFAPSKILHVAELSFKGEYDAETIKKWLRIFIRRFFVQQFKRSCVPDGVKVGSVALSPRGDWRMPSDAASDLWLNDIDA